MARNTETRRQRIFEDAMDAATKIARKEGLGSLTVRRIAKQIGCSVGTIYNVFDNLDTLILHLNGRTFDALYEELTKVEAKGEPRAVVASLTETYLGFVRDNANLWNVIFEHVWPAKYPLPDWYRAKIERLLKLLASILAPLFPRAMKMKIISPLWSCGVACTVLIPWWRRASWGLSPRRPRKCSRTCWSRSSSAG